MKVSGPRSAQHKAQRDSVYFHISTQGNLQSNKPRGQRPRGLLLRQLHVHSMGM